MSSPKNRILIIFWILAERNAIRIFNGNISGTTAFKTGCCDTGSFSFISVHVNIFTINSTNSNLDVSLKVLSCNGDSCAALFRLLKFNRFRKLLKTRKIVDFYNPFLNRADRGWNRWDFGMNLKVEFVSFIANELIAAARVAPVSAPLKFKTSNGWVVWPFELTSVVIWHSISCTLISLKTV